MGKEKGKKDKSVVVATLRIQSKTRHEYGVLVCDESGVTYGPVAQSRGGLVSMILVTLWGAFNLLNALSGGFIGFVWNFLAFLLAFLIGGIFHLVARATMQAQVRVAAKHGPDAVETTGGRRLVAWDKVAKMSSRSGKGKYRTLKLRTDGGRTLELSILGGVGGVGSVESSSAVKGIRRVIKRYAPDLNFH